MYRGQPVSEENLPGGSPTSDGTAPESNGESPEHTDSDETTVMYRGRPVDSSAE
jgi:hypothetical protein